MADVLYFNTGGLTVGASGNSLELQFSFVPDVLRYPNSFSATSDSSWCSISGITIDDASYNGSVKRGRVLLSVAENTMSQRQAIVTIEAPAFYPGQQYVIIASDSATITQNSSVAGTGSITPATYSVLTPAVGGESGMTYSLVNISTDGSLNVYSDQTWLHISDFDRQGFTYYADRNTSDGARNANVRVSAHINGSRDYAEAYITFTQPAMEDTGYILFNPSEIIATSGASSYTGTYTSTNIAHLDYCIPSDSWMTIISSATTASGMSAITFSVTENPYRQRRNGYITLYATSSSDGTQLTGRLNINQAAGTGDLPIGQVSFRESTVMAPSDEPYSGSTQYTTFNMDDSSIYISEYEGNFSQAPTIVSTSAKVVEWKMAAPTNRNGFTTSVINLSGTDTAGNYIENVAQLVILQPPYVEQLEFPIWRDTDIMLTSDDDDDYIDYIISISGLTKCQGRAYTLGGKCVVRLNEIMETFLIPELDLTRYGIQDNNAYLNGVLSIGLNDSLFEPFKKIKCFADWSYEDRRNKYLSYPITRTVDRRQKFLCSIIDYSDLQPTVIVTTQTIGGTSRNDTYSLYNQIGTIVDNVYSAEKVNVKIGGQSMEYKVEDTCKRYCLYYLNAFGGWDSYCFNKTSKESDDFTRSTFKRRINNQNIVHGRVEYKNRIQKKWTLKTDYLNDNQSLILARHMMSSPCAYLHDLEEDIIYPVIITNKSTDYKTFIRNGRKYSRYDVTVELAQDRKRR